MQLRSSKAHASDFSLGIGVRDARTAGERQAGKGPAESADKMSGAAQFRAAGYGARAVRVPRRAPWEGVGRVRGCGAVAEGSSLAQSIPNHWRACAGRSSSGSIFPALVVHGALLRLRIGQLTDAAAVNLLAQYIPNHWRGHAPTEAARARSSPPWWCAAAQGASRKGHARSSRTPRGRGSTSRRRCTSPCASPSASGTCAAGAATAWLLRPSRRRAAASDYA